MGDKKKKKITLFRKVRTQYRMVFINDESLEEVASYRLTVQKLYVLFSTLFVVIVTLTVCVLLLTPLKYYIPGYGSNKTHMQMVKLKRNVDSLSDLVAAQQLYEANIKKVISGDNSIKRDTATLNVKEVEKEQMKSIIPLQDIRKK